jgi:Acyl-CoA synthetases (AMP-forming)/AMP-acid ligases II
VNWLERHPTVHRVLLILYYSRHSGFDRDVWPWRFPHAALCLSGLLVNLIQRIDHWATAAPEAIAHLSGDKTLTYGELRRRSDGIASYLTKRFSDDRRPIAVLGHREPEMLIAFLGAVKSGRPMYQ